MSIPFYQSLGSSELLPRYTLLEPLFADARVLEVGAVATTGGRSAAFLRERGAKLVVAVDPDADAVARAQREYSSDPEVRFRKGTPLPEESGESFDLVLVADIGPFLRNAPALSTLCRLVGTQGRLVAGLRNPAGASLASLASEESLEPPPTYGEMLALLAERFGSVEVGTQTTLVGYQLAPVSPREELELAVDGTLAEVEESAYFLAVCGARPSGVLNTHTLVALPAAPLVVAGGRRVELAARLRLEEERARAGVAETEALRAENRDLHVKLAELDDDLAAARTAILDERSRARAADERAEALERRLSPGQEEGPQGDEISALRAALAEAESRTQALRSQTSARLSEVDAERERAEARLGEALAKVAELEERAKALEARLAEEPVRRQGESEPGNP